MADASGNCTTPAGAAGEAGELYTATNMLADGSGTLYYGNSEMLADGSGTLYYSGGGRLADANSALHYANGAVLADQYSVLYAPALSAPPSSPTARAIYYNDSVENFYGFDGTSWLPFAVSTAGTVTSVGLILPSSVFSVSGSPVISFGNLTGSFQTQASTTVFAGPSSGAAATPTFRQLSTGDISGYANPRLWPNGSTFIDSTGHLYTDTGSTILTSSGLLINPASAGILTWGISGLTFTSSGISLSCHIHQRKSRLPVPTLFEQDDLLYPNGVVYIIQAASAGINYPTGSTLADNQGNLYYGNGIIRSCSDPGRPWV